MNITGRITLKYSNEKLISDFHTKAVIDLMGSYIILNLRTYEIESFPFDGLDEYKKELFHGIIYNDYFSEMIQMMFLKNEEVKAFKLELNPRFI